MRFSFLLTVPVVVAIAGCNSSNSLQGKVTYNGEPVKKGSIDFLITGGKGSGFTVLVNNGAYSYKQPKIGKLVAVVRGVEEVSMSSKADYIKQRQNPHNLPVDYIPEDANGNGQTVDIVGGKQTLDFDLKGPPRSG